MAHLSLTGDPGRGSGRAVMQSRAFTLAPKCLGQLATCCKADRAKSNLVASAFGREKEWPVSAWLMVWDQQRTDQRDPRPKIPEHVDGPREKLFSRSSPTWNSWFRNASASTSHHFCQHFLAFSSLPPAENSPSWSDFLNAGSLEVQAWCGHPCWPRHC